MDFRIRWVSVFVVGGLVLLGGSAMAQDGVDISLTVGQHAVGTLPGGQTAGSGARGAGSAAAPAGVPGAAPTQLAAPGQDSTTMSESTTVGGPGAKNLPKGGGDPETLSALGMALLGLGYGVRRRFARR